MGNDRYITAEAIILATRRFGEMHRTVTLLSPEIGLVQAAAFGARKGKGKLSGWIEPFVSGVFHLYHNPVKKQYKIEDIDSAVFAEFLRNDMQAFYLASFWAEVIIKSYGGGGEYSQLYLLLKSGLEIIKLNGIDADGRLFVQSVWRILDILGYLPDLSDCASCGSAPGDGERLFLSRDTGAVLCERCRGMEDLYILPGARKYLVHTLSMPLQDSMAVLLGREAMEGLKRFSKAIITDVVEGSLNTLSGGIL